jgi:hypothetical protein
MTLKLTPLGEIATRYSVMTAPDYYREAIRSALAHADEGGDPLELLRERIEGLKALSDQFYELVQDY